MSSSAISPGLLARASPTTVAAVVATLAVSWFSVSSFRSYWRLRHIKGPPLAAWSIWWLVRTVGGTRAYLDFWEVNQKYGKQRANTPFNSEHTGTRMQGTKSVTAPEPNCRDSIGWVAVVACELRTVPPWLNPSSVT
jgi:hypothetical protein